MAENSTSTGSSNFFLKNLLFVALIGISYYYYSQKFEDNEKRRIENVLYGLLEEEKSVNASTSLGIAVGFGSCIDLFVDGISLMNSLKVKPPVKPKYHDKIETLDHVAEMFALYLSEGAAAERFIPSSLLNQIVSVAEKQTKTVWAAGGNAPVISSRFAREGFSNIIVGAHNSERFNKLSPSKLEFTDNAEHDDIHLIMEFKVDDAWGPFTVQRANRFILHSDHLNPYIKSLESFQERINVVKPRLIIISSMQMLDNFPFLAGEREERMIKLKNVLESIPKSTFIHFEMASFSEKAMMDSLIENVMLQADSLGMNEQELPNIVSMIKYNKVIEVADSNPRTAIILDQMREVYDYFKKNSKRGITRIHVHTLSFQAILIKSDSDWKNIKAGAAKASLVATRHVCGNENIYANRSRLIMDDSFQLSLAENSGRIYFNETSPISCWNESDYETCIAPVLVCTQVKQTVGGGDNITPAGLMLQI